MRGHEDGIIAKRAAIEGNGGPGELSAGQRHRQEGKSQLWWCSKNHNEQAFLPSQFKPRDLFIRGKYGQKGIVSSAD
jgi:penicillin V acylase-like amidase (Ntn superfamily)